MPWSWSEEMVVGTREEVIETERSGQSGDRIPGESTVKSLEGFRSGTTTPP